MSCGGFPGGTADAECALPAADRADRIVAEGDAYLAPADAIRCFPAALDVTDPATPVYTGRTVYPANADGDAHSSQFDEGRSLLFGADEEGYSYINMKLLPSSYEETGKSL